MEFLGSNGLAHAYRYCNNGSRLRARGLSYDKTSNVAEKILVSFPCRNNVLQRGTYPRIPQFYHAGLTDTFWIYIIPGIVSPYNIILVKTYIESIPHELEESAFIDGAGYVTIFRKIIWPLSKPILATIAIFGAVGHWNSFQDSLIYNANAPELYTLQHRLYVYLNSSSNLKALMGSGSGGDSSALASSLNAKVIQYTISMVTIIPILLVYPIMQKYFEKGIMLGAVKG